MSRLPDKLAALRAYHALHPHPEAVRDPLFAADQAFFDPRDLVQVKYEMLRRVRCDERSVTRAAAEAGLSRPAFQRARARWNQHGWSGLLPQPLGPRHGYRLDAAVLDFLAQQRAERGPVPPRQLAHLVEQQFHRPVHPRSIARALARQGEKSDNGARRSG